MMVGEINILTAVGTWLSGQIETQTQISPQSICHKSFRTSGNHTKQCERDQVDKTA